MKKFGFTLAEVLITLGIIGVVAAITLPSLNTAIQKNKVGPTLRKFVNTMENANDRILQQKDCDVLSECIHNINEYFTHLNSYTKGTIENITTDDLEYPIAEYDGTSASFETANIYTFENGDAIALRNWELSLWEEASGTYKGQIALGAYDINGFEKLPNRYGKDIFLFALDNSGAIVWMGGKQQYNAHKSTNIEQSWKDSEDKPCNETSVIVGNTCAGSVADNDWKVIYKY